MKKVILGVMFILVAALAAFPYISGMILEKNLQHKVDIINQMYADQGVEGSVEITSFTQGYLSSDIEWKLSQGYLKHIYKTPNIFLSEHVRHGFTHMVSTSNLQKNPWYSDLVTNQLQGNDPITITNKYSLFGDVESTIAIKAFSVTIKDEAISIQPGSFTITTNRDFDKADYSGSWQGFSAGDTAVMGMVTMNASLEKRTSLIWDGNIAFEMHDIQLLAEKNQIELKNLTSEYIITVDDEGKKVSGDFLFSAKGITVNDKKLNSVSGKLSAKGINIDDATNFMKTYNQIVAKIAEDISPSNEPMDPEMLQKQMTTNGLKILQAYMTLMKKGFEIDISDLDVSMSDQKTIKGDITLRLLQDLSFMQFIQYASQPELMLDSIYLKSDITVPSTLTENTAMLISPIFQGMQTGFFVEDGQNLVHKAETIDGKLIMNDKEVVLAQ